MTNLSSENAFDNDNDHLVQVAFDIDKYHYTCVVLPAALPPKSRNADARKSSEQMKK